MRFGCRRIGVLRSGGEIKSRFRFIVLPLMQGQDHKLKASLFASLSLAFASFGDAFLYPFLPVNHAAVGVPVVWIGVLLSINRFVRILSNTWIVHLLARFGMRRITIFAVMLAALSTAGYAFSSGIFLCMVLRIYLSADIQSWMSCSYCSLLHLIT